MSGDNAAGVSGENVEFMERGIAAFNSGDFDAFLEFCAPEIVWGTNAALPDLEAVYHGHDGLRRWAADMVRAAFERFELRTDELIDAGDEVVMIYRIHGVGRGSGATVEMPVFDVFTIGGGKLVRRRSFGTREEALRAAGLMG